jgi:hypothetical protein
MNRRLEGRLDWLIDRLLTWTLGLGMVLEQMV